MRKFECDATRIMKNSGNTKFHYGPILGNRLPKSSTFSSKKYTLALALGFNEQDQSTNIYIEHINTVDP